jgi:FAD/FMN-containing dehydrogenase
MSVSAAPILYSDGLIEDLSNIVGGAHVLTGGDREFYATDVFRRLEVPEAVIRPGTTEELRAAVAAACRAGRAIFTRGGGASYTDGYLPNTARSILIDVGRLDRIVEINTRDMYVTVEAGVTWATLDATLAKQGLRTPFRGPFSGLAATVGGSISQNTVGHGNGAWGISAESVVAIEAVLANGEWIKTGQAGSLTGAPFFRFYGPDLTALFTGDCGALGVKGRITLKLIRRRPSFGAVSFGFGQFAAMHAAAAECAALGVDEKAFGLDQALQQGQIGRQNSNAAKAEMAGAVLKSSRGLASGMWRLARMGLAGSKALAQANYAFHYMVEGLDAHEVEVKLALLRKAALPHGAELPNTVPTIVRGMPFAPLHNIVGPAGERWVPLHGILPHSAVLSFHQAAVACLDRYATDMDRLGVHSGKMFSPIGAGSFLYEPAFYWKDAQTVFHKTMLDAEYNRTLPSYPPNPEGAELVAAIRSDLIDIFHAHGATHLQVGKVYPLVKDRNPQACALLQAIKHAVDPDMLMNPGALGL